MKTKLKLINPLQELTETKWKLRLNLKIYNKLLKLALEIDPLFSIQPPLCLLCSLLRSTSLCTALQILVIITLQ